MDFRFSDEQQLWYDTLQTFMDKEVGREYTRAHDESREFPFEAYKKIADNGWLGILIPEEYGGMAADAVMFAIFCESMAKFSLDTAACVMGLDKGLKMIEDRHDCAALFMEETARGVVTTKSKRFEQFLWKD